MTDRCANKPLAPNLELVRGVTNRLHMFCVYERSNDYDDHCGPAGRNWTPRDVPIKEDAK